MGKRVFVKFVSEPRNDTMKSIVGIACAARAIDDGHEVSVFFAAAGTRLLDGGYIDENNYVTIADRKKDVIISGGENVSSIEVEDVLFAHEQVTEVAVIGVPDEKWGETVKALVVIEGDISEKELIEFCRSKLAHYKCPTSIEFRDELARTATGKLQKYKLRAPYWEGHEKLVN